MTPLMRRTLLVLFLFVLCASATRAAAPGSWPLAIPKNTQVIFKVPEKAIKFEKLNPIVVNYSYTISVDKNETGLTVGGFPDWQDRGWASQYVLSVAKAERKPAYFLVELDAANGNHFKLQFSSSVTDINAALESLVFRGSFDQFKASDYYQKELTHRFMPRLFTGPLAGIAFDKQILLFEALRYDIDAVASETYKGKFFLVLRLPADDIVYNTARLNQPARVARALQNGALKLLKVVNQYVTAGSPGIDGIKLESKILFRDFTATEENSSEVMQLYVTVDQLGKFADNDITNQQLIDNSIILVNGDRVAVSLTQYD
jgi:hypothetical protein